MRTMDYRLTKHAETVLAERGIAREWLETVLARPQKIEPDEDNPELEHRLGRIAEHGNRVLRVVVDGNKSPVVVVTLFFDRTMRDKL